MVKGDALAVCDGSADKTAAVSKEDYGAAVHTVEWLKNLHELELPKQESGLAALAEILNKIPALQKELGELRALLKTKQQVILALEKAGQKRDREIAAIKRE
ncbi:MAG TPA: hypothetical protein GX528_06890 [Firmicutes bacterium]|nr:hypothetical protein [Bacillota bacterium]